MLAPLWLKVHRAAGPFTPRNEHAVTRHEPWHRYVPESSNWHGGTLTRWIAALPAATVSPELPKLLAGRGRELHAVMYLIALALVFRYAFLIGP